MTTVNTVLGAVTGDALGRVLPHEHIASVYGMDQRLEIGPHGSGRRYGRPRDDREREAFAGELLAYYEPLLNRLAQDYDCRTLVEVSPHAYRSPLDLELWGELTRRTGVHIVPATGYYVAPVRPADFDELPVAAIADGMIREIVEGIEGTRVRAGIIKVAVGDFGPGDRKLLQAAAIAQRETGLSITTHTCSPDIRRGTLDLLEGAGVPPERIYLGHADANGTLIELLALVRRGCSVLLTIWGIQNPRWIGWGLPVLPRYHSAELVAGLIAEGYGDRVLASIDGWAGYLDGQVAEYLYEVEGRSALYLFTHVLDQLRSFGVLQEAVERVLRDNPRRMLERQGQAG